MSRPFLPADDLPPGQPTPEDMMLRRCLAEAAGQRFYESCDRITQSLLYRCEWHITLRASLPTLIIACPDTETYWHIVSAIDQLGNRLRRVMNDGKIRVYPPIGKGQPYEIGVDELQTP
jgi:hypothetical protein